MKNETNTQHGNKGKTPWNKGNLNPYINARGYRCFKIEGKEIREHRMVMEQKLGRKLLSTELVHHVDGDKLNNHPDNLELRDWSEHTIEHHTGSTRKEYTKRTIEVMANYRWEVDRLLKENEQLKERAGKLVQQLSNANIEISDLQALNAELLERLKLSNETLNRVLEEERHTVVSGDYGKKQKEIRLRFLELRIENNSEAIAKAELKNLGGS